MRNLVRIVCGLGLGLLAAAGLLLALGLAGACWLNRSDTGLLTPFLILGAFGGVGLITLRQSRALLRPALRLPLHANTYALLLGLLLTLFVVGACLLAYPPGSAGYDQTPDGRIHAVVSYQPVPLWRTLLHITGTTAALALLPLLLWLLARRRQRTPAQPASWAGLLGLTWLLLLAGWLFLSDWYPPANID
jgi:hypothetical protein